MPQVDDLSRCLVALNQDHTLAAVVEMSAIELAGRRTGPRY